MAHGGVLRLGARPLVMAVLNVTPDSFADAEHLDVDAAIDAGLRFEAEGADLIDVGGESTRPGATPVSADEEGARVLPVVRALAARTRLPLSVDTYKAAVARAVVAEGATIVNDISALAYDPDLPSAVAAAGAAFVITHNRGRSRDMYRQAEYDDVAVDVARELNALVERAAACGVSRDRIIVDPGIGFAKRPEHSYGVLARLSEIAALVGRPILAGPSRKSFLRTALGERPAAERDWGTAAAVTAAVLAGAHIVRVHDPERMAQVVRVAEAIRKAGS